MGLDQYLYLRGEGDEPEEIFYWRKHPDLHGFMASEWLSLPENSGKGAESFNCEVLTMTEGIVERLEACTRPNSHTQLPETQGFFFGQSDGYYEDQDRKAVEFMKGAIEKGQEVYYYSWW